VEALRRLQGDGMVGGRVEICVQDRSRPSAAELFETVLAFPQESYIKAGFAATANVFTTRATFDRTGLFDKRLMSGGDVEWGHRVRARGLPQVYAEDVWVSHSARRTLRDLGRKARRVAGGVQSIAERERNGGWEILAHAKQQLVLLRRIRANIGHTGLGTFRRKLKFAAVVWCVEFFYTAERCRVFLGGAARRT
jgi:GT2 family glycosyltransferase